MNLSWKRHKRADGRFDRKNVTNQHFYEESLNKKNQLRFFQWILRKGKHEILFLHVGSMLNQSWVYVSTPPFRSQTSQTPNVLSTICWGKNSWRFAFSRLLQETGYVNINTFYFRFKYCIISGIPWVWTIPKPLVCMNSSLKLHNWADGRFDRKNVTNQHFYEESLNKKISWDFFNEFLERGNTRSCSMLNQSWVYVSTPPFRSQTSQTSWAPSAGARTAGGSPFPGSCKEQAMLVCIHSMIPWVWTIPKPWVCMNSSWKLHNWADGRFDRKNVTNQHFYEESLNKKNQLRFVQWILGKGKHEILFLHVGSMLNQSWVYVSTPPFRSQTSQTPNVLSTICWGKNSWRFAFSRLLQETGYVSINTFYVRFKYCIISGKITPAWFRHPIHLLISDFGHSGCGGHSWQRQWF